MQRKLIGFLLLLGVLSFGGCGSGEETTSISVEERFQQAKALFDDEDYLDAIDQFNVITLQHQGSAYADDAQFYLGESRFERGEFLLAAFEYQQLKRSMPASPFVPQAQYRLALSYYNLAPKPPLDQQYTLKAIDEFLAERDSDVGIPIVRFQRLSQSRQACDVCSSQESRAGRHVRLKRGCLVLLKSFQCRQKRSRV